MDVTETVTAILRLMMEKSASTSVIDDYLVAETTQKIMLVYYTACTSTNDDLVAYLPPLEVDITQKDMY